MENPDDILRNNLEEFEEKIRRLIEVLIQEGGNYYTIQNILNGQREHILNQLNDVEEDIQPFLNIKRNPPEDYLLERERYLRMIEILDITQHNLIQFFNIFDDEEEDTNLYTQSETESESESEESESEESEEQEEFMGIKMKKKLKKPRSKHYGYLDDFIRADFDEEAGEVLAEFQDKYGGLLGMTKFYIHMVGFMNSLKETIDEVVNENIDTDKKAQIIRNINEELEAIRDIIRRIPLSPRQV